MLKEITEKEFAERYPEKMIYGLDWCTTVYLENGVILINDEWNGEVFTVKNEDGSETVYRPVQKPDEVDENGEVTSWETIGYEEWH